MKSMSTRPSGLTSAEIKRRNLATFKAWASSKSDADFRDMVSRGGLSRTEIFKECGFARSVLTQNELVAGALADLEASLRKRGVLPTRALSMSDGSRVSVVVKKEAASAPLLERLSRLEQENASLRAETRELRRQLSKFAVLQEVLEATGRLPR